MNRGAWVVASLCATVVFLLTRDQGPDALAYVVVTFAVVLVLGSIGPRPKGKDDD